MRIASLYDKPNRKGNRCTRELGLLTYIEGWPPGQLEVLERRPPPLPFAEI